MIIWSIASRLLMEKFKMDIGLQPRKLGKERKLIREARHASMEGFTVFVASSTVDRSIKLRNKIGYDSAHDITMLTPRCSK